MKVRSLLFSMLCMLVLSVSFTSCSDDDNETRDDTGSKVRYRRHVLSSCTKSQHFAFIIEGVINFYSHLLF